MNWVKILVAGGGSSGSEMTDKQGSGYHSTTEEIEYEEYAEQSD